MICTGGMSVDPDDKTPLAIKKIPVPALFSYGAPVLPGAMFLLAYYDRMAQGKNRRTVIMGLPGCVITQSAPSSIWCCRALWRMMR